MSSATRKQLEAEAAKHGAEIDWHTADEFYINIDAPRGKVWACDGSLHTLNVSWGGPVAKWRGEAFADAIGRMSHGTALCKGDLDCDCGEQ